MPGARADAAVAAGQILPTVPDDPEDMAACRAAECLAPYRLPTPLPLYVVKRARNRTLYNDRSRKESETLQSGVSRSPSLPIVESASLDIQSVDMR